VGVRLGAKLTLWVLIPLLLVLTALATLTLRREHEVHYRQVREQAERTTRLLAIPVGDALRHPPRRDLATIVRESGLPESRVGVVVFDAGGAALYRWGLAASTDSVDSPTLHGLAALPGGRGMEERLGSVAVRSHIVPLLGEAGLVGVLQVSLSLREVEEVLAHERNDFLGMLVAVSLVLVILTFVTIRHQVGLPLERLMRRVASLGSGETVPAEEIAGHDEVAQLAREFNALSQRLGETGRRLAHESEYATSVIQSITDGIIVIDRERRILSWNRAMADRYGISEGEVLHRNLFELFPALEREGLAVEVDRLLSGTAPEVTLRYFEHETLRRGRVVLNIQASALRGASDEIRGVVLAIEDVSDRVALTQEVEQAEKLAVIGQLAAGIAHQIGTPLNVISGSAEYLMMEWGSDKPRPQELDIIVAQTDRIAKLIRQLLNFARPARMTTGPLKLNDVLQEVLGLVEHQIAKERVGVWTDFAPDLPAVSGDGNQLEQAFLNIVINAWHAMPGGGTLYVSTRRADRPPKTGRTPRPGVEAAITDTGSGIAPEHMDRIFDPFFTTKGVGKGTGLGLAITRRIVEDHRGGIQVTTEVGRGTTFRIWLPADEGTA
jgi:PAS domain S-box-containing protein